MIKQNLIVLVAIMICEFSFSQVKSNIQFQNSKFHSETGEKLTIESVILEESKDIFIGLPNNYNDSTKYPVVLILEGEILFETVAPLTKLMGESEEIPQCITVGIPLYNNHLDYAPKISTHPESGNADRMLNFYRHELFPLLDSLYNLTEDKIIWAHSALAGIFCTYILLGPDDQFTGILSSSPNLRWMQEYINKENAFEDLSKRQKVFYYLTFGGNESEEYMGAMYQQVQALSKKLESKAPDNLIWTYQLNENNNHFTNAIETYIEGLVAYFNVMK